MSACFQKQVHSKYSQAVDNFNMKLAFFQRKKHLDNDRDIVMGKINIYIISLLLWTTSRALLNFLTISTKFNFTCVYIFTQYTQQDLIGK